MADHIRPNELLSYEREQRHWTQDEVAHFIGAPDPKMVGRWERGVTSPSSHYRQMLMYLFGKRARELGLVSKEEVPFWFVLYRRNRFFTGRDAMLDQLHALFASNRSLAPGVPLALSGLGGVGKTQFALEYAYRYSHEYLVVAWIPVHTAEVLAATFAGLAELLNLPEKQENDRSRAIEAVKARLAAMNRWLLIFDNVEDMSQLEGFFPTPSNGHILLTTRNRITGTVAQAIDLETMSQEEGALFLLRRAKLIPLLASSEVVAEKDLALPSILSQTLGGLPLALDQAAAYIEETSCGLESYLQLYQTRRKEFLQRRGSMSDDHPEPVSTTWSLAFEQLRQRNPAVAELLAFLAFLAPDAIPEELITAGFPDLGTTLASVGADPLLLNQVFKELRRFSLVSRNVDARLLTIHRLVQLVLLESMERETQQLWAERAARAIIRAFPSGEVETLPQCGRLLAQIDVYEDLITHWEMTFPEVVQGLHRMGNYFLNRSWFNQAERLFQRALSLSEKLWGPEHPEVAEGLAYLGSLYLYQFKYGEAEQHYQRALAIYEKVFDPDNSRVAEIHARITQLRSAQVR